MSQQIRQQIITLAKELPDERLPEVLELLQIISKSSQPKNQSQNPNETEYDRAMAAYQVISEKYKNALRELA